MWWADRGWEPVSGVTGNFMCTPQRALRPCYHHHKSMIMKHPGHHVALH